MLTPSDAPTRLLDPHERPAVVIAEVVPPPRYRALRVLARLAAFCAVLVRSRIQGRQGGASRGRALRHTCEALGGLWIKVGQLLSLRIDVFSIDFCRELSHLQERRVGFPGIVARTVVESDLGVPVDVCFAEFDDVPFAAVPMGQVHRARLRDTEQWVAVKVQQPYLAELFARDLVLIRWFVRLLLLLRIRLHTRWAEALSELEQMMREDLDFRFEASSMRRMRRTLHRHRIHVPRVMSRYCGPRVLVSEFVHGVLMSDYLRVRQAAPARLESWLRENRIDPRDVARRLLGSMFRQVLEDNLYHGDLRPENIVLLRDSRIALIDFRTVTFTEREYLLRYGLFIRALATRDYAKAADLAFMLCAILPVMDIEVAKEKVIRALRAWATRTLVKALPYDERSIDAATVDIVGVMFKYKCTMEWAWLRIHRTMSTLDLSLAALNPELNHTKEALRYFQRASRRSLSDMVGPQLYARALGSVRTAMDIQERINEYTMFQGSLIRRHAQVFQGATNRFADTFATFVRALAIALLVPGVLLVAVLIGQHAPETARAVFGRQILSLVRRVPAVVDARVAAALLLVDVYLFVVLERLTRRLRQKDVRVHERVASV